MCYIIRRKKEAAFECNSNEVSRPLRRAGTERSHPPNHSLAGQTETIIKAVTIGIQSHLLLNKVRKFDFRLPNMSPV